MAFTVADRVQETTSTTGTGPFTLGGAVPNYRTFNTGIGANNTTFYTAADSTNFEVGVGTVGSGGTTLSRDTVLASSNAGALVNFSAGVKTLFSDYPATNAVFRLQSGLLNVDMGALVGTKAQFNTSCTDGDFVYVNDSPTFGATITTGQGVSTGDCAIELGGNRTGDGASYIDFHATAGSDFDARIIRSAGVNGTFIVSNTGTGQTILTTGSQTSTTQVQAGPTFNTDGAGIAIRGKTEVTNPWGIDFFAGGSERVTLLNTGTAIFTANPTTTFAPVMVTAQFTGTAAYNSGNSGAGISFRGAYDAAGDLADLAFVSGIKENTTNGDYGGALLFGTRANGSGGGTTERLRIGSDGTIAARRDPTSEMRFMNAAGTIGYRIIQTSSTSALGSFHIQGTNDGYGSNFSPDFIIQADGQTLVSGAALWLRSNQGMIQHDGTNMFVRAANSGGGMYLGADNQNLVTIGTGACNPTTDNTLGCGWSTARWTTVYAVTGAINTSDEREKLWRGPLTKTELRAAKDIAQEIGMYQWLSAIEDKTAAEARYHCGVRAQRVWEIMASYGLVDPIGADGKPGNTPYAFLCWDEWDEHTTPSGEGGAYVTIPAGDRYGVRYAEITMFLAAAQEQHITELEARLAALEAKA
jgi:hypothetical protein